MGIHAKIVGVTYDNPDGINRQDIISSLKSNSPIFLKRDYANIYDPNAIKVVDSGGVQLGFISRELASQIAPQMDSGKKFSVSITGLTGGNGYTRGVNIYIND